MQCRGLMIYLILHNVLNELQVYYCRCLYLQAKKSLELIYISCNLLGVLGHYYPFYVVTLYWQEKCFRNVFIRFTLLLLQLFLCWCVLQCGGTSCINVFLSAIWISAMDITSVYRHFPLYLINWIYYFLRFSLLNFQTFPFRVPWLYQVDTEENFLIPLRLQESSRTWETFLLSWRYMKQRIFLLIR